MQAKASANANAYDEEVGELEAQTLHAGHETSAAFALRARIRVEAMRNRRVKLKLL